MLQLDLDYVRGRRLELGITQQQAAEKLGFKRASTYLKYESGVYELKAKHLPDLAKLLNCKITNFFIKDVSVLATSRQKVI